jgi:hypothetical protein
MKSLSDKQLAANRANATRSTGPRTSEGKARAALNSRKHGLSASTFTATRLEDRQELENLIADAVAFYDPQNSQEQFAVERIALCQLSILRAYRLEAGAVTDAYAAVLGPHAPECGDKPSDQVDTELLGQGFQVRTFRGHSWTLILRYQAQADRQYRRAVDDFERLKLQRDDSPNEPISAPESNDLPIPPDIVYAPIPAAHDPERTSMPVLRDPLRRGPTPPRDLSNW